MDPSRQTAVCANPRSSFSSEYRLSVSQVLFIKLQTFDPGDYSRKIDLNKGITPLKLKCPVGSCCGRLIHLNQARDSRSTTRWGTLTAADVLALLMGTGICNLLSAICHAVRRPGTADVLAAAYIAAMQTSTQAYRQLKAAEFSESQAVGATPSSGQG